MVDMSRKFMDDYHELEQIVDFNSVEAKQDGYLRWLKLHLNYTRKVIQNEK